MHPCSRGEVFPKESRVSISDYWPASLVDLDINVKETKALSNTLFSFGDKLRDARVDAYVDNQALVRAWQSQAARSRSFSDALKELSNTVLSLNLHLSVFYIPSRENPADHPSRRSLRLIATWLDTYGFAFRVIRVLVVQTATLWTSWPLNLMPSLTVVGLFCPILLRTRLLSRQGEISLVRILASRFPNLSFAVPTFSRLFC